MPDPPRIRREQFPVLSWTHQHDFSPGKPLRRRIQKHARHRDIRAQRDPRQNIDASRIRPVKPARRTHPLIPRIERSIAQDLAHQPRIHVAQARLEQISERFNDDREKLPAAFDRAESRPHRGEQRGGPRRPVEAMREQLPTDTFQ